MEDEEFWVQASTYAMAELLPPSTDAVEHTLMEKGKLVERKSGKMQRIGAVKKQASLFSFMTVKTPPGKNPVAAQTFKQRVIDTRKESEVDASVGTASGAELTANYSGRTSRRTCPFYKRIPGNYCP